MSPETQGFEFGEFLLDAKEKILLRQGKPVHITPKALQLLFVLVENHGHIVEKQSLMETLWSDSFVEEGSLTFTVRQLRKILGDHRQDPIYIETIPKRGYRFIAAVTEVQSKTTVTITDWYSRPILVSVLVVLVIAALVSGGYYVWNGRQYTDGSLGSVDVPVLTFETVVSSPNPMNAAISPDGRYIAYTSTTNGRRSLWLRQVATGVNTEIVAPSDDAGFYGVAFSSDGEYVYFARRFGTDKVSLDRVSIFGGTIKERILDGVDGAFSLSADGRHISFRRYTPEKRSLFIAEIDGANEREIFSTAKTLTGHAFSPDGKTVAFAFGQADTGDRDFGVYTVGEDGEIRPATDFKWLFVRDVIWLPDEKGLLVSARVRNEPQQVWLVSLETGDVRPVPGMPVGVGAISATRDLKQILVTQMSRTATVYLASQSEPNDLQPVAQGWESAVWAPDRDLVYDSLAGGNDDIWLLTADMKSQKQLTTESSLDFDPVISPDGRHIVFVSDRAGKYNVWRMNPDGNDPVRLTNGDGEQSPTFTPDGQFVLFNSMKDSSLWRVPVTGGEAIQVLNIPTDRISISSDGTKFAHFVQRKNACYVSIRSFEDASVLREFEIPKGYFAGAGVRWTSDGKYLVYTARNGTPVDNLWQQPIDGGPPRKLTNYNTDEIYSFDFSPDDSQIAITRGYWNHDTVLVRDFRIN